MLLLLPMFVFCSFLFIMEKGNNNVIFFSPDSFHYKLNVSNLFCP